MDSEKRKPKFRHRIKNKLRQKLSLRGPRSKLNHIQGGQANCEPDHEQQLVAEGNTTTAITSRSESPGDLPRSSSSTSGPAGGPPARPHLSVGPDRASCYGPGNDGTIIHDLWNIAYENLSESDESLIKDYEARLKNSFTTTALGTTLGFTLGSRPDRQNQMHAILQRKMDEINKDTWKLKFGSTEAQIKDLVQPVLGVVNWANEFITSALRANSSASIAWGGVSLLLPLFLNPSKQAESLAKGLEDISSVIVQGRLWEGLYSRRCKPNISQPGEFSPSTIQSDAFKKALEKLYQEILRFQIGSYCYYDKNTACRFGQDMVKWKKWDDLLVSIREKREKLVSINEIWKDTTYEDERSAADRRHEEAINCWQTLGTDVSRLVEVVRDSQLEKERQDLLDWLCTIDPSVAYNAARDKHTSGTSDWLIRDKHFKAWEKSASSLLWLNGKAGSGKSIMSSSVIKHLREQFEPDPRTVLAYFFFSFSDPNKQKVDGMLASLLRQICASRPDTPECILNLAKYKERGERPDTETLGKAVLAATHGFSGVFIVIDALDECPSVTGERGKLLTNLSRIIATMSDNIHILCTSRAESDILVAMRDCLSRPSRSEIDLTIYRDSLNRDIALYVDMTLTTAPFKSWPIDLKEDAKESLLRNADGMFQYIRCQFEAFQDFASPSLVRAELQRLPVGLDATYERILLGLKNIFRRQIINVLKWLTSSNRDLSLEEVAEVFILDTESEVPFDKDDRLFEPAALIKYMSSLIVTQELTKKHSGAVTYVRLAHFTVKEYLMSDRIAESPVECFSFNETDAHLHIAHASLAYHLYSIPITDQETSELVLRDYAVKNWMSHLELVPRQLWSANVSHLAAQAFAMRSKSLCAIFEADESTLTYSRRLSGLRRGFPRLRGPPWIKSLRTAVLKRPYIYTALKGLINLTEVLLGGGGKIRPFLTQRDMDISLQYAAFGGCTAVVRLLLDRGANCHYGNGMLGGALQAAAYGGHLAVVKLLLEAGANINARHKVFGSALRVAAFGNHLDVVSLLVRRGCDLNAFDAWWAASQGSQLGEGNLECLRLLLDSGADINRQCPARGTALHHAAATAPTFGNMNCIRMLLDRGADVNLADGEHGYPLHAMCHKAEDSSDIKPLLDSGADVNAQGSKYCTALQALFSNFGLDSHYGKKNIAMLLLNRGADINVQGGYYGSALQAACSSMQATSYMDVQFLIENGADVAIAGGRYGSPLQAACNKGDLKTVQILLDKGASVNTLGGEFGSALQAAAANIAHGPELLGLLLSKGVDVNTRGGRYGCALQAACVGGNAGNVLMLLDHGAEVNAQGGMYGTAFQAACHVPGESSIPLLLMEHGADVHWQGGMFGNAWHAAASNWYADEDPSLLQFLLAQGFNIDDARGVQHTTALHAALESNSFLRSGSRIERIERLLEYGANVNVGGGKYGFPLQSACAREPKEGERLTKFLLARCHDVDVNAEGGFYGSALQAAAWSGQTISVRMLLNRGADVNATGGVFGSALQAAAYSAGTDLVLMLLDAGANIDANGGVCRSALNAAIFSGFWDTVELLLERGAIPDSQQDAEWLEDVRDRLGQAAVERYWKFWEKKGSEWRGVLLE